MPSLYQRLRFKAQDFSFFGGGTESLEVRPDGGRGGGGWLPVGQGRTIHPFPLSHQIFLVEQKDWQTLNSRLDGGTEVFGEKVLDGWKLSREYIGLATLGVWQYGEDVWGRLSLQGRRPLLVRPAVVKQEEQGTASQPPAWPTAESWLYFQWKFCTTIDQQQQWLLLDRALETSSKLSFYSRPMEIITLSMQTAGQFPSNR